MRSRLGLGLFALTPGRLDRLSQEGLTSPLHVLGEDLSG